MTDEKSSEYEKNRQRYPKRTVSGLRERLGKKYTIVELGFKHVNAIPKHTYIYPYDKKLRKQILMKQKPYPKRGND
jgi:hypothetical protein